MRERKLAKPALCHRPPRLIGISHCMAICAQPPNRQSLLSICQDRLIEPHHDLSENRVMDPILTGFRLWS